MMTYAIMSTALAFILLIWLVIVDSFRRAYKKDLANAESHLISSHEGRDAAYAALNKLRDEMARLDIHVTSQSRVFSVRRELTPGYYYLGDYYVDGFKLLDDQAAVLKLTKAANDS